MLTRFLATKINELMSYFPVVVILGVRQCGKTTLSKMVAPHFKYFDLENINDFDRVTRDIPLFFEENSEFVIIDEAQKSPELFSQLRGVIDKNRKQKGRFILTGSASFELLSQISESLAGRVGIIELMPFKLSEILNRPFPPFFSVFENKKHLSSTTSIETFLGNLQNSDSTILREGKKEITFSEMRKFLFFGGHPDPALSNDIKFKTLWMENYFNTYINRDIRSYYPRIDLVKYKRLISALSYITDTIINKSELARSIECSEGSVREYMEIIEGTFFWRNLISFQHPKFKNTLKLPKGHFRDSGLNLYLQKINAIEDLDVFPKMGNIFESFVVEEIIKGVESTSATNLKYHHFRTKAGQEIDLILEGSFGIIPVEIKYQSHTNKDKLQALINFVEKLDLPIGLVINNSSSISKICDKIWEIPVRFIL